MRGAHAPTCRSSCMATTQPKERIPQAAIAPASIERGGSPAPRRRPCCLLPSPLRSRRQGRCVPHQAPPLLHSTNTNSTCWAGSMCGYFSNKEPVSWSASVKRGCSNAELFVHGASGISLGALRSWSAGRLSGRTPRAYSVQTMGGGASSHHHIEDSEFE